MCECLCASCECQLQICYDLSGFAGGWHLAPPDATACDSGLVANPDQCQAAIKWLSRKKTEQTRRKKTEAATATTAAPTAATIGAMYWGNGGRCTGDTTQEQLNSMDQWGKVPLGCSIDQSGRLHYKKSGTNCNDGTMQLVCSGGRYTTFHSTHEFIPCC